jgi:TRAP-type C4-dicarboxylate transport system permease large subunit
MLPAIPLFTLGGYILAEGGSSKRLMRLSSALVGWMPGGLAIVTTLVLAFFTPLTGASGITILSMGGLFLPVLEKARYPQNTAIGLVTV